MTSIGVGDLAPAISGATQDGQTLSLADYRGQKVVVLFFYPKDGTAICTSEACAFRDAFEDFVTAGAVVLGVSGDSTDDHRAFADNHRLPFPLLSDSIGAIRAAFGVPKTFGVIPGRVTYVIDRAGIVRHVFNSQLFADRHVREALEIVRKLATESQ